ncbi:efflux transporter outer membrane subunit [Sulfurimonas sp. HSL3-7]|uniref:efflux transporter outer membrane subunit n=1 Tax=Sulfonitrofixus jiaomeiensis TaxID=3131938 RepID=UPI0031F87B7B
MRSSILLSVTAILLMSGCSMAPKLEISKQAMPATLSDINASSPVDLKWWEQFGDERLNTLITEALANNDDLKLALSNVTLARATLGLSNAERYPTIDGSASAYRQKTSGESLSPFSGFIYNSFDLSLSAAYEFDFWGKYSNMEASARAEMLASEADMETVRISLISSVAELYFALITFDRQIKVTAETVEAYKESYDYRRRQYDHGVIDALVLEQAHSIYANAKLQLATYKEEKRVAQSALAVLIGRSPDAMFNQDVATATALAMPLEIPEQLSSNLLQQRPDIRAAEERMRAANATIGVAKAAYFPSISLTGTAGFSSTELGDLLKSSAGMWGFGPSLNVPIFDFGRIENSIKIAEAKKDAAVITYAKTVKNAFKEVYDALIKIESTREKLLALNEETEALEKVLMHSQQRFDSGYGTYLEVVASKRALLSSRINLIAQNDALIANQITLYKALGGGWEPQEESR